MGPLAYRAGHEARSGDVPPGGVLSVAGLLLLVGLLDHAAGLELSVLPLYILPLALATTRFGLGAGLWAAGAASLVWCFADINHGYSHEWFRWVNVAGRAVMFSVAVLGVAWLSERTSGRALPGVRRSESVALCAGCHAVRTASADDWMAPADFLSEEAALEVHRKLCPVCAQRRFSCGFADPAASANSTTPTDEQMTSKQRARAEDTPADQARPGFSTPSAAGTGR